MNEVIDILKKVGAIITDDHFVLTSGKHSDTYINKDALYPHTKQTSEVGKLFAQKYQNEDIQVVVGPALGGIILSQWTAYHLTQLKGKEVLGVYTEKDANSNQIFSRRGYDQVVHGKKVLIVEDLTTTGGSVKKVVHAVRAAGGDVVAVCVMVNRDPERVTSKIINAPFSSLAEFKVNSYDESECPLCKKGIPINTKIGHGKKFLESKQS